MGLGSFIKNTYRKFGFFQIIGAIFVLVGLNAMFNGSFFSGLFIILLSSCLFTPVSKFIGEKLSIKFGVLSKSAALALIFLFAMVSSVSDTTSATS